MPTLGQSYVAKKIVSMAAVVDAIGMSDEEHTEDDEENECVCLFGNNVYVDMYYASLG